jgi:hypothetical protein
VKRYAKFFKQEMKYHKVISLTDETKQSIKESRTKTLNMLEEMQKSCSGIGINPYSVNLITVTCHGIISEGDAIAVVPQ